MKKSKTISPITCSSVFTLAWIIVEEVYGWDFNTCLRCAYIAKRVFDKEPETSWEQAIEAAKDATSVIEKLREGGFVFWFKKGNGKDRLAFGTLDFDLIPDSDKTKQKFLSGEKSTGKRRNKGQAVSFYDLKNSKWISFNPTWLLSSTFLTNSTKMELMVLPGSEKELDFLIEEIAQSREGFESLNESSILALVEDEEEDEQLEKYREVLKVALEEANEVADEEEVEVVEAFFQLNPYAKFSFEFFTSAIDSFCKYKIMISEEEGLQFTKKGVDFMKD